MVLADLSWKTFPGGGGCATLKQEGLSTSFHSTSSGHFMGSIQPDACPCPILHFNGGMKYKYLPRPRPFAMRPLRPSGRVLAADSRGYTVVLLEPSPPQ